MALTHTVDEIYHVVTRIGIPPGQVTLYQALYGKPDGLTQRQLADTMRWGKEESLTSVLGPLARRVNDTPGFDVERPGYHALIHKTKSEAGPHYAMKAELRAAIDLCPSLTRMFTMTVRQIHDELDRPSKYLCIPAR